SVTGGLPFFGGPGNNYVTHSIAEMMQFVRRERGAFGMVTANGSYLTKHSVGIYSTMPLAKPWLRQDPKVLQRSLDARPTKNIDANPTGAGLIETYCVAYEGLAPRKAFVFGRRAENDARFIAIADGDAAMLEDMTRREQLGRRI